MVFPKLAADPLWEEELDVLLLEDEDLDQPVHIIVWNDDVNSFDWVTHCFMDILGHTFEQADQLALIIHTKGKAIVKTGPKLELRPQCEALQDRGLSAEMDES
ncbi:MAG: ATP-dependent Clp protease adaptor ClpS [Bacteroidetes bacterium]|nr:ATP-dependent Clp protease adaptor ClpS [Bacteroidota bacterium]